MLFLYNTLSRKKEPFHPIDPQNVKMYVCGPTVYDYAHLGNARPVVVFDLLFRLLKQLYPDVTYVRNITDIDDKIMKRAAEKKISIKDLTMEMTRIFHEDMASLGALAPTHEPRATDHIQGMINIIQGLIDKKVAYVAENHVLFHTSAFKAYGCLSRLDAQNLEAGLRVDVAPYKKAATDFVLWKPSSDDQPGWESPWGRGRPGWHIECSAMSSAFLGQTFDIHGGGIDLIFPHHENEIAQSCAFFDAPSMARFWVHNGHLTVDNEKMSKSLGNFVTVHALLKEHHGETLRYAFLSGHYRQPLNFSNDLLSMARNSLDTLYTALEPFKDVEPGPLDPDFLSALQDDLNTPLALSLLHDMARALNKTQDRQKACVLKACSHFIALLKDAQWFQRTTVDETWINEMIQQRALARQKKDFKESDRLRAVLEEKGIILDDTPSGTKWRAISS